MTANPSIDDSQLDEAVRRTREGETAAFEVVVRRFERSLRTWLAGHVPPGIDVDDVAQRTFVAAFSRLGDYTLGTRFEAWLYTIARYQLKTELTRLRRVADYHARYAPDLLQRELERRNSQQPELFVSRLEHLRACVEMLAEHLRRFITWRYDEGIPLEEMATRSGRSVAAVKKQLWLIRRKLQQCIENRMAMAEGEVG